MANFSSGDFRLSSELSPDLAIEDQRINRRQKIADLLIGQGLEPINNPQHGRFYVAPHPLQGLGKMAQAAAGAYMTYKNDQDARGLVEKNKANIADALMKYRAATAPTPAIQGAPGNLTDMMAINRAPFNQTATDATKLGVTPQGLDLSGPTVYRRPEGDSTLDVSGSPNTNVVVGAGVPDLKSTLPPPTLVMPKSGAPEQPNPGARDAIREALVSQIPQVRQMAALDYQSQEAEKRTKEAQDFQSREHALTRESNRQTQLATLAQHKATLEAQLADRELGRQENATLKRELQQKHEEVMQKIAELNVQGRKDVATTKAGANGPEAKQNDANYKAGLKDISKDQAAVTQADSVLGDLKRWQELNAKVETGPIAGRRPMSFSDEYQELQQIENRLGLVNYVPGQGQISNFERSLITGSGPRTVNNRETNNNITKVRIGALETVKDRAQFRQDYLEKHGKLLGSDKAWSEYVEKNPKFIRDKSGAIVENPNRTDWETWFSAPKISGDEEYNALPSGSHFIDPKGERRVKP